MGAPCSPTVEKILCRSLFSKRSHIGNLRRIRKQGKGRSSKRKGNRRCPFLFAHRRGYGVVPRRGARHVPAVRRRRIPPLRFSEKLSARKGRTRLRQFECPGQPMQKKSRPVRANPPAAVRAPRSADAEKEPPVRGEPACGSSRAPVSRYRKKSRPLGANTLTQFACPGQPMQKIREIPKKFSRPKRQQKRPFSR